jgi:hypothetical protein
MKKKSSTSKISKKQMAAVGAGVAALGAGAYYLFGPKGKAHRKKVGNLTEQFKKEVYQRAKKAKNASIPLYHKTIDMVSAEYRKQYKANEKEIRALAQKLKNELKTSAKKAVKAAVQKKTIKKAKKTSKAKKTKKRS